jgi:hypothetical protein
VREIVQSTPKPNPKPKFENEYESELEAALVERSRIRNRQRYTVNKIKSLHKVKGFLDSIGRNSKNSEISYSTGLALFQDYLDSEAFQQRYHNS